MVASANDKPPADKPTFGNLLNIAFDAVKMWPPYYVRSVLGPVSTWLPPHNPYSEFTVLDPWRTGRALKYLVDISVPSVSGAPPRLLATVLPPAIENLFFVQTEILHRPDYYDNYTSYPDEHWFFINGILTNGDVAHLNAACISWLFHRPVTLIQNATDGAIRDLWECALGKEWYKSTSNTEAARVAFPAIYDALRDPFKRKVVVICHSQGTIIMSVVLQALHELHRRGQARLAAASVEEAPLEGLGLAPAQALPQPLYIPQDEEPIDLDDFDPLSEPEWDKLEVYFFATCANDIRYHRWDPDCPVPWIENFGNEHDIVARLGMLAPEGKRRGVHIEGPQYVRRGAWGHLLNIDYLLPIAQGQKRGRKRGGRLDPEPFSLVNREEYPKLEMPRLFNYINGGSPKEDPGSAGTRASR